MPAKPKPAPIDADALVRGQTVESLLRKYESDPDLPAIVAAIVRRYDAKAARREARAA